MPPRNSSTHSADYQQVINEWDIATREREFAEAMDRSRALEIKVLSVILGIPEAEVQDRWAAARATRESGGNEGGAAAGPHNLKALPGPQEVRAKRWHDAIRRPRER
jgi:hypothetical protein